MELKQHQFHVMIEALGNQWQWLLGVLASAAAAAVVVTMGARFHHPQKVAATKKVIKDEMKSSDAFSLSSMLLESFEYSTLKKQSRKPSLYTIFEEKIEEEFAEENCKGSAAATADMEEKGEDYEAGFSIPKWADALLQPSSTYGDLEQEISGLHKESMEWDDVFDMHREMEMDWKMKIKRGLQKKSSIVILRSPVCLAKAKDEVVRLWDSSKRRILSKLYLPQEQGTPVAMDLNWVYKTAAMGTSEGFVALWDFERADVLRSVRRDSNPVKAVQINIDGGVLLEGASSCVSMWDSRAMMKPSEMHRTEFDVMGLKSEGLEMYVKEGSDMVRGYDLRMLKAGHSITETSLYKQNFPQQHEHGEDDVDVGNEDDDDANAEDDGNDDDDDYCWQHDQESGGESDKKSFFSKCLSVVGW